MMEGNTLKFSHFVSVEPSVLVVLHVVLITAFYVPATAIILI